ncbi:MAG: endopeptidase [Gemmatimonadetes bacterium]|nr:endopeptidase [Gemmatimonadota bacterium]
MRRAVFVLLALVVTACNRQLYSAPAPVSAPAPTAPSSRPRIEPLPPEAAANFDVVSYIIGRSMLLPVAGATVAQLHDTFDEGRDTERVHRALDIMAPRGTPVLSTDAGRILRVGSNPLGGNIIYASDPLGRVVYYYAHLDAYQPGLAQGAAVARGDTLGFVGTTGNAPREAPHLHFQVMRMPLDGKYWDGDPINPYPLFLLTHDPARP